MKIMLLDTSPATLIADSAWRPDRRPYFVPEPADTPVKGELRIALRIDRLGKNIAPQFAFRYVGAATIVALFTGGNYTPYADDSMIMGRWISISDAGNAAIECAATSTSTILRLDHNEIASRISDISTNTTFKTGDIIIMPEEIAKFDPNAIKSLSANLNGSTILEFTIK